MSFANWLLTVIECPLELKPIFDVLDTNSNTCTHAHRIFLKIVKLRIIYSCYTLLYSQNLFWPQNFIIIVDVWNFRLNFLYSDIAWKPLNLYTNISKYVHSIKKKQENLWYINVHDCYLSLNKFRQGHGVQFSQWHHSMVKFKIYKCLPAYSFALALTVSEI